MANINLYAAWTGILLGFLAGAVQGMFFHREGWLGGYGTWPRRMTRLGHVSFFGIAFINLAFAFSAPIWGAGEMAVYPSALFIAGAVTMPLCCYLAAYRKGFRHLFFVPVLSLVAGAVLYISGGMAR